MMHLICRAADRVVLKVISVLISALLYRVINQVRKVCALKTNAYEDKCNFSLYKVLAAFLYPS